jgi:hypothetical protein
MIRHALSAHFAAADVLYESKFREHAPSIYELANKLSFLASCRLLKTGSAHHSLMGNNPVFRIQTLSSRVPFEGNKVHGICTFVTMLEKLLCWPIESTAVVA